MMSFSSLIADPLGESLLNKLELLEALATYLDRENPYGNPKYWKHLAQYFGVEASTYENFTCIPRSPTEKLFAYTPNANMADHLEGLGLVARKRG